EGLRGRREHLSAASIYEGLGDAINERWNAPGFRERRHAPVRPCPHTSLADFAVASAQTATPDSENGRYSFNPVADGVLLGSTHAPAKSRSAAGAMSAGPARWCRTSARRWRPRSLACRARTRA